MDLHPPMSPLSIQGMLEHGIPEVAEDFSIRAVKEVNKVPTHCTCGWCVLDKQQKGGDNNASRTY